MDGHTLAKLKVHHKNKTNPRIISQEPEFFLDMWFSQNRAIEQSDWPIAFEIVMVANT